MAGITHQSGILGQYAPFNVQLGLFPFLHPPRHLLFIHSHVDPVAHRVNRDFIPVPHQSDGSSRCGFGHKPVQQPGPPIYFSGLRDPKRSANRVAKYGLHGWIGIQDTPREFTEWRTAIARELEELGKSIDDLDMCSMIWFTITDEDVDQTDNGKVSNILVGSERQLVDMLKTYQEAGMTMPLLWPPFADVPVSKTLDDLKRLKHDIMPKVDAI